MGLGTEPVVVGWLVGGENNIVALPNANKDPCCVIRYDGYEIGSNDSKRMTIKGNADGSVDGWVDKAKAVLLARLDFNVVVLSSSHWSLRVLVGAVDENIGSSNPSSGIHSYGSSLVRCNVVPILHGVRAEINIIISCCRTVDAVDMSVEDFRAAILPDLHDCSQSTIAVLSTEVRVVPTRSVFSSTETVSFSISRGESALCDSIDLNDTFKICLYDVGWSCRLTPSSVFEWSCRSPCQWIEVPLCCILLRMVISKVSPQFPMIVGPGSESSMSRHTRSRLPSGLQVVLVIERSYLTTCPVLGHVVYMSVVESKPGSQQFRLLGPLVQPCFFVRV